MRSIITAFQAGSSHGYPSFAGLVVHSWAGRDPTEGDAIMARLLVDRGLGLVEHERLAHAAARAERRAAKLALDVITCQRPITIRRAAGRTTPCPAGFAESLLLLRRGDSGN
jgi:hypothetical protein